MGWGPVATRPENPHRWYQPTETILKCSHCGAIVKAKGKQGKIQNWLVILIITSFSFYMFPSCVGICKYFTIVIGLAAIIMYIVNSITNEYELVKKI